MKPKSKTRNKRSRPTERKRVVVMGGGTGTYTVLSGLKKYPVSLTAIVTMADDGGSTGRLRDELGVLPPGDVRQCLVALSRSDQLMRELISYRFPKGSLKGHSFGNILLSALEKVTGSFDAAVERASDILRLAGNVVPATLTKTRLAAHLKNGKINRGENTLHAANLKHLARLELHPRAEANPKAIRAIAQADAIILGPGDFFCSLVPNLLVKGLADAICKSRAKKIFICNLMTKAGHTKGWRISDFVNIMESYLGCAFDVVVYNKKAPSSALLRKYARKGEQVVRVQKNLSSRYVGADLISKQFPEIQKGDRIRRSLIRHNPDRLASLILRKLSV